jgi:DNA-binding GntR family transcriptional regulator
MIDTTPLNDQIVRAIKEEILNGQLEPGQKISIGELAQRWNVSTTPVRDAIRSLESAGFVHVSPRKSITIAQMDIKAFKDVFDLRIALECLAVEQSMDRIPQVKIEKTLDETLTALDRYNETGKMTYLKDVDYLLHDLVISYCDNNKLVNVMDELHDLIEWTRSLVGRQPKSYSTAVYEHIEVLKAFKERDVESAVRAMRIHLKNSFERTCQSWNELSKSKTK